MTTSSIGAYWRVKWAAVGAVLALTLVGLAWLLMAMVKSPQEALASASPPPPSQIVVPVENRTLDLTVHASGQIASPTTITGTLSVADRARAKDSDQIVVKGSEDDAVAKLKSMSPDGGFVVRTEAPLEGDVGSTVQVSFEQTQTERSGLVVPISALFTSANSETSVVVIEDGAEHEVTVSMGASVAGFVAVTPLKGGSLAAGDAVLVSEPAS